MKYKIEKNTVQETLILPLYSRKLCTELYPNLYRDETAVRLIDEIDYDFSEAEKNSRSLMQRFGALEVAMRQNDLAFEVQAYLKNLTPARRWSIWAAGWITPAEPATMADARSTIWTSRM
ncbi:MAG: hypothetical protein V8Q05_07565 [Lachnospiraceae bacterium]